MSSKLREAVGGAGEDGQAGQGSQRAEEAVVSAAMGKGCRLLRLYAY